MAKWMPVEFELEDDGAEDSPVQDERLILDVQEGEDEEGELRC